MGIFQQFNEFKRKYEEYLHAGVFTNLPATNRAPKKSILRFRKLSNLAAKYDDEVYHLFGLSTAPENYEYLLSFGEDKLDKICQDKDMTAYEAGKILYGEDGVDSIIDDGNSFIATQVINCIKFNKATGLNLVDYNALINPAIKLRLNSTSMLEVFENEKIDKEKLAQLSRIYGTRVFTEYRYDRYLISKTIPNKEDHSGIYQEFIRNMTDTGKLREISDKYFNGIELRGAELNITIGLLQKYSELIDKYTYNGLLHESEKVKHDMDSGSFRASIVGTQERKEVRKEDPAVIKFREALSSKKNEIGSAIDDSKLSAEKLRAEKRALGDR